VIVGSGSVRVPARCLHDDIGETDRRRRSPEQHGSVIPASPARPGRPCPAATRTIDAAIRAVDHQGGFVSGHSKWATTKHQKAVKDARRAKSFAKLIKNIEVAAKIGGADLSGNPTLVDAVQKAKKTSVPNENIDRAIKRGAGLTGESIDYQTIMYEGYGPNGVALLVECLTDNRNRAAAEVRTAMSRNGGTMADPGSVAYNFSRKGVVRVAKTDGLSEDDVLAAVLDAGVEDVTDHGEEFEVVTEASDLVTARTALQSAGIDYESADAEFVPGVSVEIDDPDLAKKVLRLVDALEDLDDVQNVFANFDLSDEVATALDEE
jgi:YebC/PmpR family DNA-binding regulatory protein